MKIQLKSKNYCDIIFKDDKKRDLLLILPGGGYTYTSPREALPVANAFMPVGLHAAIFYYREEMLLFPKIMDEAVELLDKLVALPQVNKINVIGFSAGGHYAALMITKLAKYFNKGLLIYPVISTLPKYIHISSYEALLGKKFTGYDIDEISADLHVHEDVCPTFMMHSVDDPVVPVENSISMLSALRDKGVYTEAHFYPTGGHGISIDSEEVVPENQDSTQFMKDFGYIASWVELAKDFLKREIK
jgi:acetyl esterase/lipase